jgi:hypothetical protein
MRGLFVDRARDKNGGPEAAFTPFPLMSLECRARYSIPRADGRRWEALSGAAGTPILHSLAVGSDGGSIAPGFLAPATIY